MVVALVVVRTVVACIVVASEVVDRTVVERRIVAVRIVVADRIVAADRMVVVAARVPAHMQVASETARNLEWRVEKLGVVDIAVADPCPSAPRTHQSCLAGCSKVPRLQGLSS